MPPPPFVATVVAPGPGRLEGCGASTVVAAAGSAPHPLSRPACVVQFVDPDGRVGGVAWVTADGTVSAPPPRSRSGAVGELTRRIPDGLEVTGHVKPWLPFPEARAGDVLLGVDGVPLSLVYDPAAFLEDVVLLDGSGAPRTFTVRRAGTLHEVRWTPPPPHHAAFDRSPWDPGSETYP